VTQRALFPRRVTHEELNSLVDKAAADCKFILVLLFLKSLEIFLEWLFFELTCLNPARFHLADAVPGLKRELVCSLKMPLPPFSEQREIADILSAVDEKLEIERGGKAKLERIKHGLMGARVVFMKTEVCCRISMGLMRYSI